MESRRFGGFSYVMVLMIEPLRKMLQMKDEGRCSQDVPSNDNRYGRLPAG